MSARRGNNALTVLLLICGIVLLFSFIAMMVGPPSSTASITPTGTTENASPIPPQAAGTLTDEEKARWSQDSNSYGYSADDQKYFADKGISLSEARAYDTIGGGGGN